MAAGRLVITDGSVSVALRLSDDTNKVGLLRGRYMQQVGGVTKGNERLIDEFEIVFREKTDVLRGATLRDIAYLKGLLEQRDEQGWVGSRVWLEAQTASEGAIRYAEVHAIGLSELGYRHWRVNTFPRMSLYVERDALWRDTIVGGSWGDTFVDWEVWPCWIGAKKNVAGIAATEDNITGDVAALTRIELERFGTTGLTNVVVAAKTSPDEAALNRFVPFFNAVDEQAHVGWQVTDATVPGGKRLEVALSGSDTELLQWDLPGSATWDDYAGSYLVYAVCEVSDDDVVEIAFDQYNLDEILVAQPPDFVKLTETTVTATKKHVLLGRVELAPEKIDGLTLEDNPVLLHVRYDGSTTFKFYYWYLIPLDGGLCGVNGGGASGLVLDGDIRERYSIDSGTGDVRRGLGNYHRVGDFIELYPSVNINLYFYGNNDGFDSGSPLDAAYYIRVQAINRFLTVTNEIAVVESEEG